MGKMQFRYDAATSYLYELGLFDPKKALQNTHEITSKAMLSLGFTEVPTFAHINHVCDWIEASLNEAPYWCFVIPITEGPTYYNWYFRDKKNALLFKLKWG